MLFSYVLVYGINKCNKLLRMFRNFELNFIDIMENT